MGRTAKHRVVFGVALLVVVVLGVAARLMPWELVLGGDHVALKLSDSHYYVRYALLQLESFPRFVPFDPFINHPTGAHIYWPPLHTWTLSLLIALFGEGRAELAAAWSGPVISAVLLVGTALLCRAWFGSRLAIAVTALLALVPVVVESGALGNADHHVYEPFLMALGALASARVVGDQRTRTSIVAGLLLGSGRLFTPLSFLVFPLVALTLVVIAVWHRERAAQVARSALLMGGAAAAVSLAGVLLFGRPWSVSYEELSLFHPAFAMASLGGAALVAAARVRAWRSAGVAATVSVVGAVPVLIDVVRAMGHLGRADPLLAAVEESLPLYAQSDWALRLFGPPLLLLPFAIVGAVLVARRREPLAIATLVFFVPLALAAVQQVRFTQAAAGAVALVSCVGGAGLWNATRFRTALVGLVAVGAALTAWSSLQPKRVRSGYDASELVRPTLAWMRARLPPAAEEVYSPDAKPSYGVVSRFDFGHLIVLWAERPVVASPFGQARVHVEGNARASAVLAARSGEEAFAKARETGARYVLSSPFGPILGFEDVPREQTWAHRLLEDGGLGEQGSAHFRLIYNSKEQRVRGGTFARVIEVVPGAELKGSGAPGAPVVAELELVDNLGQRLRYRRSGTVDGRGAYSLRVAHSTQREGDERVRALGPYRVTIGESESEVEVGEHQVIEGVAVATESAQR